MSVWRDVPVRMWIFGETGLFETQSVYIGTGQHCSGGMSESKAATGIVAALIACIKQDASLEDARLIPVGLLRPVP